MSSAPPPRGTFRVARSAIIVGMLGLLLDFAFWRTALHVTLWSHLACVVLLAGMLAAMVALADRDGEGIGTLALALCLGVILAGLWVSDGMLAHSSVNWSPFEAQRLGILAIALLAPPRVGLGLACITLQTLVPLVEWATWGPAVRARLPVAAPWMVVAYAIFACVIYAHQLSRQELERRAAVAQAEADALERFAGLVMSLRDAANTPLQTIELTVSLMRRRRSWDARALDRLERAAGRLADVGRWLEQAAAHPGGSPSPGSLTRARWAARRGGAPSRRSSGSGSP